MTELRVGERTSPPNSTHCHHPEEKCVKCGVRIQANKAIQSKMTDQKASSLFSYYGASRDGRQLPVTPDELEMFAEQELVEIVPNFSLDGGSMLYCIGVRVMFHARFLLCMDAHTPLYTTYHATGSVWALPGKLSNRGSTLASHPAAQAEKVLNTPSPVARQGQISWCANHLGCPSVTCIRHRPLHAHTPPCSHVAG